MSMVGGVFDFLVPVIAVMAVVMIAVVVTVEVTKALSNTFRYPYFVWRFDVSGKRNVDLEGHIDRFLNEEGNREALRAHRRAVGDWKRAQEAYLERCRLKKRRRRQYLETLDDGHDYRFQAVRFQTRYRQRNHVRTSYRVPVVDSEATVDWTWLVRRAGLLAEIGYEATLKEYHARNQRRLMTPRLRHEIMERDDYTCQICGKYIPDEVGLHIDHIVPIEKGGKSVPSNLQVLCSKCNGSKGAKTANKGLGDVEG